jgi:Beta-galactosidase
MQAKGKPTVIFIAGDQKPNSYYMHTPEETVLMMAQTVSNGANIWYGIHAPTYIMDCLGGKAAERFLKFLEKNDEYYINSRPYSNVALMWSVDSANYYRSSIGETDFTEEQSSGNNVGYGDLNKAFMGVYEMLGRQHIQFDVIDEDSIHSGLCSKYELIVIPSSGCMSEGTAAKIREYVYKGGNLVCFFDCSFFSQTGEKNLKPYMADLLGIEEVGDVVGYGSGGFGYMFVKDTALLNGLGTSILLSPEYVYDIKPARNVEVIAYSNEPMKSRYTALPQGKYPVILKNEYGNGLCYYLNGTFGEFFTDKSNPDHSRLLNNIISVMSKPILVTDAPGSVEMIIREQRESDRLLLHIANMTGEMTRPVNRIIPLYNTNVSILVEKPVVAVRNIALGTEIPFKIFNGRVEFVIPVINQYELYSIDFGRC